MAPPSRILVIRLSAIGDIVFASPIIAALRRAYPRAHLAWLAQPECAPLLRHHPDLDQVITWPRGEWHALWRERRWGALWGRVRALRAELRRQGFDLVLDLQGLLKSGLLAWLSGARQRVGLGSREGSQWLMTRVVPRGGDPRAIGSEYRFLAETLGLPLEGFAMSLVPGEEARAFALDLIERRGLGAGYAVLCPFTTRPQKHWFEARWAELATRLHRELGLPVLMMGGPADGEAAGRIQARYGAWSGGQPDALSDARPDDGAAVPAAISGGDGEAVLGLIPPLEGSGSLAAGLRHEPETARRPPIGTGKHAGADLINLAGATSLLQAAALIESSQVVIGVDTGLSHMGIAFGRPSLLLFGSTRPYLDTGRANARVLYHPLPCSPCKRRPTCGGAFDCMRLIGVEEVLSAARDLLRAEPWGARLCKAVTEKCLVVPRDSLQGQDQAHEAIANPRAHHTTRPGLGPGS